MEEQRLECPRCNKELKKIKKKDIIIDVCPLCKGMWLDDKEIDKLLKVNEDAKKRT